MLPLVLRCPGAGSLRAFNRTRNFSHTALALEKPLPPRIKFNEADLTVSYLKGSGPGGQKINKTNSAVQLTHNPSGTVVKCQATRSQSQNHKIATQLLADKVEQAMRGDHSRVAIKAERARRKKASGLKKRRRKYRQLDGGEEEEDKEGRERQDGEEGDVEKGEPKDQDRGQG